MPSEAGSFFHLTYHPEEGTWTFRFGYVGYCSCTLKVLVTDFYSDSDSSAPAFETFDYLLRLHHHYWVRKSLATLVGG
jgi:hypothetical protein